MLPVEPGMLHSYEQPSSSGYGYGVPPEFAYPTPIGEAPVSYGDAGGYGYGSAATPQSNPDKRRYKSLKRRRLNALGVFLLVVLPWTTFAVCFGLLSSSMRFNQPEIVWTIVAIGFIVTAFCGYSFWRACTDKDPAREPNTIFILFPMMVAAWVGALVLGSINFSFVTNYAQQMLGLNRYQQVDPQHLQGNQMLDAGVVFFAEGSRVDLTRAMSFKHKHTMYCVAPIVKGGANAETMTFDFWAVGTDCCSQSGDFHCGAFNDGAIKGMRNLGDEARPFYRLAVQQAEAAHKIRSVYPLFLNLVKDPDQDMKAMAGTAGRYIFMGCFAFLLSQFLMIGIAFLYFARSKS